MTRKGVFAMLGSIGLAIVTAAVMTVPDKAVEWHNYHMDKRYLVAEVYQQQLDIQQLSTYRRDIDALKREKIRAEKDHEEALADEIQFQIEGIEEERRDYKSMRGLQ